MSINEWDGFTTDCFNSTTGCVPDGATALKFYGLDMANYQRDVGILIALMVGVRIIGFLILKFRVYLHEKR
jgi:hypothetical protein